MTFTRLLLLIFGFLLTCPDFANNPPIKIFQITLTLLLSFSTTLADLFERQGVSHANLEEGYDKLRHKQMHLCENIKIDDADMLCCYVKVVTYL